MVLLKANNISDGLLEVDAMMVADCFRCSLSTSAKIFEEMALKEFCQALHQCAVKLEEEMKYNINEISNLIYSKKLTETQLALEKAKDYHYKEILDTISKIFESIRKIMFHRDKIEWLSSEQNFTKEELRRFSYVKRQVYAFSNNANETSPPVTPTVKKEKRRTASEISIGSLEAWENYLDKKDKEEEQVKEQLGELKPQVSKRPLSNVRRRKKFVSSTLDGFLEGDEKKNSLDSILEDSSSVEENERLSHEVSLESLSCSVTENEESFNSNPDVKEMGHNALISKIIKERDSLMLTQQAYQDQQSCSNETDDNVDVESDVYDINKNVSKTEVKCDNQSKTEILDVMPENTETNIHDPKFSSDSIPTVADRLLRDEKSIEEIMSTILDDPTSTDVSTSEDNVEEIIRTKPKIVDVIYKKKPS